MQFRFRRRHILLPAILAFGTAGVSFRAEAQYVRIVADSLSPITGPNIVGKTEFPWYEQDTLKQGPAPHL